MQEDQDRGALIVFQPTGQNKGRDIKACMLSMAQQFTKDMPKVPSHGPPIVVHCSADVGRSGACSLLK